LKCTSLAPSSTLLVRIDSIFTRLLSAGAADY
jgi:hypothetical protein